jgi:hypothetical protein
MAGTIVISTIQLDSGNDFTIVSNTGTTLVSANGSGINAAVSIADGTITQAKLGPDIDLGINPLLFTGS